MLSKTPLLAIVFSFCFISVVQAASWQNYSVKTLLDHQTYLSTDFKRFSPLGITVPSAKAITPANQCFVRQLERFLDLKVRNQTLKVKHESPATKNQLYHRAHLKFDKTHNLAEFLLHQGWAQVTDEDHAYAKTYKQIEVEAQKAKRGQWGSCDSWYKLRERQRLKGQTIYFDEAHKVHLAAISAGWVKAVLSPNLLELQDGAKVVLQGTKTPDVSENLNQCWQQQAVAELEKLVLGKKVLLEKDLSQLTSTGRALQRYVWLPATQKSNPLLLNQHLLTKGWAELDTYTLDKKYAEHMQTAAQQLWQQPKAPAIWQQCATQAVLEPQVEVEVAEPVLEYDAECPIKGNIAGSKKNPKKTYHTPLSGWYKRLAYEACFKNPAEAEAAGFKLVK